MAPTPETPTPAKKTSDLAGHLMRKVAPFAPVLLAASSLLIPAKKPAPAPPPTPTTAVASTAAPAAAGGASAASSGASGNSLAGVHCGLGTAASPACTVPYPMLSKGHPVDWWFVFKLNAGKFPKCGTPSSGGAGADTRTCPFGGTVETSYQNFGMRYVYASAEAPALTDGGQDCLGTKTTDPLGATFDEVYNGKFHYVVWNDQFYETPVIPACGTGQCESPWGHSKGLLAWNDQGEGLVMQVSTPDWPGAGSAKVPRAGDGNTLGCIAKDNDINVSQHFFALRLTKADLIQVLAGLSNASVGTDPKIPQIVNNGGPADVQAAVSLLGVKTKGTMVINTPLSTGVTFIAKPSNLNVPPWQLVSAELGGVPLRAATWWASPTIPSTKTAGAPGCWDASLPKPGAVDIATTGHWDGVEFGLTGSVGANYNHAKIGVSTSGTTRYAIFGDMNQQGTLVPNAKTGKCDSSQNGRGGMFFAMKNTALSNSLATLITGDSAPAK